MANKRNILARKFLKAKLTRRYTRTIVGLNIIAYVQRRYILRYNERKSRCVKLTLEFQ